LNSASWRSMSEIHSRSGSFGLKSRRTRSGG
jgi:hypothetical protein